MNITFSDLFKTMLWDAKARRAEKALKGNIMDIIR